MKRKHKQYFVYYIKDNILIFDVFDYIEELAADYVDYCYDWKITSNNNMVTTKPDILKGFLETNYIGFATNITKLKTSLGCHILFYYNPRINYNQWSAFFQDPNKFITTTKKFLKKKLLSFIEIKKYQNNLFQTIKGSYKNIPCLIPSGEDESFIMENLKNLK
jgi:hypothetical protein